MLQFVIEEWAPLAIAASAAAAVIGRWLVEQRRHQRLLDRLDIRIHVNGTRGKSTLVRYLASILREAGIPTIAKTSGSATRLIDHDGREIELERRGAPTILEQVAILRRHVRPTTRAVVIECMALRPDYQAISEERMVRSTTGVVTNVRADHGEQMGESLPEIAGALAHTLPRGRTAVTAEAEPDALAVLEAEAAVRGTRLRLAETDVLAAEEVATLGPFAIPANVALALAVADEHGIDREVAWRGLRRATRDPGAARAYRHQRGGRTLYWVDLFGVNDSTSARDNLDLFLEWIDEQPELFVILNNRADRSHRIGRFVDFVATGLACRGIVVTGEAQPAAVEALLTAGVESERIHTAGDEYQLDVDALIDDLLARSDAPSVAMVGLANLHTAAAEALCEHLENIAAIGAERTAAGSGDD